jgi:TonB family protein
MASWRKIMKLITKHIVYIICCATLLGCANWAAQLEESSASSNTTTANMITVWPDRPYTLSSNGQEYFSHPTEQWLDPPPITHLEKPIYPPIAAKAGLTGRIILKFRVTPEGKAINLQILRGQEIFRQAAIDALLKTQFQPPKAGTPTNETWAHIVVRFTLRQK